MSFPKIIYGTAWKKVWIRLLTQMSKVLVLLPFPQQRTTSLVVSAVLQGFRAIDTACQPKHYQEKLVGEALQTLYSEHGIKREDLFLQTKYTSIDGQDTSQPLPYDPTASITDQVLQSFQTSLSNLQTTYLDSYILHSPLRTLQLTMEAWRVLMNLQDEGKVRLIGISNAYDKRVLEEIIKEGRMIDTVQNRWYEGNGWDAAVAQFCKEHGIYYQ
ncbi:hypothetical protein FRC03_006770 [Tulasnella sp. 419]|nr:hypothetical protein FRC03_006770 [Tulasnella sp. 419]